MFVTVTFVISGDLVSFMSPLGKIKASYALASSRWMKMFLIGVAAVGMLTAKRAVSNDASSLMLKISFIGTG